MIVWSPTGCSSRNSVATVADTARWVVGVDVGGTFTDFYAFDRTTGAVRLHKTPSTPDTHILQFVYG